MPGFTRGLAFVGPYAFIGLSQVREHVFDGIPLTGRRRRAELRRVGRRHPTGERSRTCTSRAGAGDLRGTVLPGIAVPEIVEPGRRAAESAFVLPDEALAEVPDARRA